MKYKDDDCDKIKKSDYYLDDRSNKEMNYKNILFCISVSVGSFVLALFSIAEKKVNFPRRGEYYTFSIDEAPVQFYLLVASMFFASALFGVALWKYFRSHAAWRSSLNTPSRSPHRISRRH
ncbi:hypothetical protein [Agrobacterium sp. El2ro-1b]|uniref:hypothetical protein n=1 Tax=Agrobacterium sp. El2ro-1b TaxID=2969528 RepID=UPI003AACFBA0